MRKKTSRMIVLVALLFFTCNAFSQQKELSPPAERAAKVTEWMKKNLQLTDDQVPRIEEINLQYATKNENLRTSTAGKRQKMKTLKENDQAKDAELKQVLTGSQYKTYLEKKDEIKEKLKEKAKAKKGR